MSLRLSKEPVVVGLKLSPELYELSVVTNDRPYLFAKIAGTLAAWGMNIIKASAFSNDSGVIVDSFHFTDTFRTLELNPTEIDRFKQSVKDVVAKRVKADDLLRGRRHNHRNGAVKIDIETRLEFDTESSTHSTLLQVVAQDEAGLLRQIALTLAKHDCNIEVALVDTEGETAIDVFYLTTQGKKLDSPTREHLASSLLVSLEHLRANMTA
jgi:[protein-PII] uridylyltransferase